MLQEFLGHLLEAAATGVCSMDAAEQKQQRVVVLLLALEIPMLLWDSTSRTLSNCQAQAVAYSKHD